MKLFRGSAPQSVTVANSATTSNVIKTDAYAIFGLVVPSTFDGTTITFSACDTQDGTFQDLYNTSNVQVSMTIAASRNYDLPAELAAWAYWKIVCGTAQTGATVFKLVCKG